MPLLYRLRLRHRERRYRVWFTLLYVYLCMVAYVTLMPFQLAIPGANRSSSMKSTWSPSSI